MSVSTQVTGFLYVCCFRFWIKSRSFRITSKVRLLIGCVLVFGDSGSNFTVVAAVRPPMNVEQLVTNTNTNTDT